MTSVSHTTPTAPAPTFSRPRVWAWPLAIILGFPIGGYIANLTVGAVDSVGAALAGGLIAGAVVGAAQWLALRRVVPWIWIAATSIGMAAGLTLGAALVDYGIGRVDLMLMGAVTGAVVGGLQAVVLARQGISGAAWWAVANPPAWALAWLVSSYVISAEHRRAFHELRRERLPSVRPADRRPPRGDVPPHRGPGAHSLEHRSGRSLVLRRILASRGDREPSRRQVATAAPVVAHR